VSCVTPRKSNFSPIRITIGRFGSAREKLRFLGKALTEDIIYNCRCHKRCRFHFLERFLTEIDLFPLF
jgi:hypothetical protein